MRAHTPPTLSRIGLAGLLVLLLAATVVLLVPLRGEVRDYERSLQSEALTRGGEALRVTVSRLIEREWDSVVAVSRQIDPSTPRNTQRFVDAAARASEAIAWAGYVSPGGIVKAGTGNRYVGADVSGLSWFRLGRERGTVSSVRLVGGPEGDDGSPGIVNFVAPVLGRDGQGQGVLVYSIGLDWLRGVMTQAAEELRIDMAVLDRNGETVISRLAETGAPLEQGSRAVARLGTDATRVEEGADGTPYLLRSFPELISGDMPRFDWALVVQTSAAPAAAGLSTFLLSLRWSILALVALGIGAAALFAGVFLKPVLRLAREADRIAAGEAIYPTESHSSEESHRLSSALPRIQSRLESGGTDDGK